MLNSNFFDIRLSKQVCTLPHCTQVPVSDKKRMHTTCYAEQIHICAKDKGSMFHYNIPLYICF